MKKLIDFLNDRSKDHGYASWLVLCLRGSFTQINEVVDHSSEIYAEQFKPKWISVKDNLPEAWEEVLVCQHKCNIKYPSQYIGMLDFSEENRLTWFIYASNDGFIEHDKIVNSQDMLSITHWMPLLPNPLQPS